MTHSDLSPFFLTFLDEHDGRWDHGAWLELLDTLRAEGLSTQANDDIGLSLESTRVAWYLRRSGVKGLGPRRVQAVVDRFGTMWSLLHASPDDLADVPKLPRAVATELSAALAQA